MDSEQTELGEGDELVDHGAGAEEVADGCRASRQGMPMSQATARRRRRGWR